MNEANQTEFSGWARVEVIGHQQHIGFVTTQATALKAIRSSQHRPLLLVKLVKANGELAAPASESQEDESEFDEADMPGGFQ